MSERHYTYRAEWSPEDEEYVGLVAEFPSLSWLAPTMAEAIVGVEQLVNEVIEDMEANGEPVPQALADRRYSGKIALRTSQDLHRRLTIEAAEQNVSLNQWIVQKLSQPLAAPARAKDRSHRASDDRLASSSGIWRPAADLIRRRCLDDANHSDENQLHRLTMQLDTLAGSSAIELFAKLALADSSYRVWIDDEDSDLDEEHRRPAAIGRLAAPPPEA